MIAIGKKKLAPTVQKEHEDVVSLSHLLVDLIQLKMNAAAD